MTTETELALARELAGLTFSPIWCLLGGATQASSETTDGWHIESEKREDGAIVLIITKKEQA